MRRFILTSQKFTGNIEVHYDSNDTLSAVLFRADLADDGLQWIKNRVPVKGINISECFTQSPVVVEEKEFEVTFEDFKREYPYSRNMHLALAYWPRLTSSEQYAAYISCFEYRKYCERNTWYKAMLPEKYLKSKQWLNDWKKFK